MPPINAAQPARSDNSPVELPTAHSSNSPTGSPRANPSNGYYEDADPRFAERDRPPQNVIPSSLVPGYAARLEIPNSNPQPNQPRSYDTDDGSASVMSN